MFPWVIPCCGEKEPYQVCLRAVNVKAKRWKHLLTGFHSPLSKCGPTGIIFSECLDLIGTAIEHIPGHLTFQDSVQFSSVAQSCLSLCDSMDCSTPGLPVHHQLPEFTHTHIHWVGDAIQQSHPLLSLLLPPSIFPSIRVFSSESVLPIRWPKYWSFSVSISPSNEYSGLISFRMDWLDLLAVQGTLKSLLQHHSSKPSILWHSTFLMVQLSHQYTMCLEPWKNHSFD